MTYIADSNRPHEYHLSVKFFENDRDNNEQSINVNINNPFKSEDSNWWVCQNCSCNRCEGSCPVDQTVERITTEIANKTYYFNKLYKVMSMI